MTDIDLITRHFGAFDPLTAMRDMWLDGLNYTVRFYASCSKSNKQYDEAYAEKKYHANGIIKKETVYINEKKHGIEKEYDQKGQLIKETPYKNHKKTGIQKIYRHGKLLLEIPYVNNKKYGLMKGHYSHNKTSVISYLNGQRVG